MKTYMHPKRYTQDVHSSITDDNLNVETIPCPSTDASGLIKMCKMWDSHTTEKKNEPRIHATTWTNHENTLSERSQTQHITYYVILFI